MEEFAYTVAHDLREPLRAVSLYTQVLVKSLGEDIESRQMAEFLLQSTGRMSKMVADLLLFARTGIHAPAKLVNLHDVMEKVLSNLALEIEESEATVIVQELPSVWTDETHMVAVFQNLVSNAIKYRRDEAIKIQVSAEQQGSKWVIRVEDNGVGIAAKFHSQVFLPFKRLVNQDIPGTGLGLAVCKKSVESLGGAIWVESELGSGSTFAFTLSSRP